MKKNTPCLALISALSLTTGCSGKSDPGPSADDTPRYSIGGTVTGLQGGTLEIQNNGGDTLSISSDGTYSFATKLEQGSEYTVSIKTQPENQECTILSATGEMANADISTIDITCSINNLLHGKFIDSPVEGLHYKTNTRTGTTDAEGTFTYLEGEVIQFSLGSTHLGNVPGMPIVTPIELALANSNNDEKVTTILRLLQTLDSDRNPENGIKLREDISISSEIDIYNADAISNELKSQDTDLELISPEDASSHFQQSLAAIIPAVTTYQFKSYTLDQRSTINCSIVDAKLEFTNTNGIYTKSGYIQFSDGQRESFNSTDSVTVTDFGTELYFFNSKFGATILWGGVHKETITSTCGGQIVLNPEGHQNLPPILQEFRFPDSLPYCKEYAKNGACSMVVWEVAMTIDALDFDGYPSGHIKYQYKTTGNREQSGELGYQYGKSNSATGGWTPLLSTKTGNYLNLTLNICEDVVFTFSVSDNDGATTTLEIERKSLCTSTGNRLDQPDALNVSRAPTYEEMIGVWTRVDTPDGVYRVYTPAGLAYSTWPDDGCASQFGFSVPTQSDLENIAKHGPNYYSTRGGVNNTMVFTMMRVGTVKCVSDTTDFYKTYEDLMHDGEDGYILDFYRQNKDKNNAGYAILN